MKLKKDVTVRDTLSFFPDVVTENQRAKIHFFSILKQKMYFFFFCGKPLNFFVFLPLKLYKI